MDNALKQFHPAVAAWFSCNFSAATEIQTRAWPAIRSGEHTLIAAPTGSGKTLAAFLAAIDQLIRQGLDSHLSDQTNVLYISPLKALSNDVQKNLQLPLNGIRDKLLESCLPDVAITAWVRTGDTPSGERQRMVRKPPHIVVTTPESLYILLTSGSGRAMLKTVKTVIVDEIHALAGNKRGAHLSLSLQRLDSLCQHKITRIGLSATQKPINTIADFLTGGNQSNCNIIDVGHHRQRDISIEIPNSPLEAIMANEVWDEQYTRLTSLIEQHSTTLIFVNNRRLAERAAHNLAERLGEDAVTAHHGSLSREHRLDAEQRLKAGKLRALVATASLELGIDIGDIDLVCQIGSPRSISAFLQRVGRSGHSVGGIPKGRLFPLTRDDLVECTALLDAIRRNDLDKISIPIAPLDVLAQQIVAEVSAREWSVTTLHQAFRTAWPYRDLNLTTFIAVIQMLADGFSTRRGRRSAYLHYDRVNGIVRARRAARLTAVMNGGAIPDHFDYDVILEPEGMFVGSLNEDFAFESLPGDIFQLGNTSYRIHKIQQGKVFVFDAKGQPPNIPFWFGEVPGRTDELSLAVSQIRATIADKLHAGSDHVNKWLQEELCLPSAASCQLTDYIALAKASFGAVPTAEHIMFERFFDETGDMHFVIHAPLGSRINRAWGLALRKRFCRKFNFELQAAATEDNIILSLGPTHSFPLDDVIHYLKPETVREILIQAMLDAPVFATRWRWNCNIALAVPRMQSGKRVPAQFQRNNAEDLVAVIFPDQLACFENLSGNREVPDHPLVAQTINDCLHENMDIIGLEKLLSNIESGKVKISCHDLSSPSPLSAEIINARPYAFLDDTPAEERRTLAVNQKAIYHPDDAALLSSLDTAAVQKVMAESWPSPRDADELHDALVLMGFLTELEAKTGRRPPLSEEDTINQYWLTWFEQLTREKRVTQIIFNNNKLWVTAERLQEFLILYNNPELSPLINPATIPNSIGLDRSQVLVEIIRSRLECLGPVSSATIATDMVIPDNEIQIALLSLEQEGFVVRGRFIEDFNKVLSEKNNAQTNEQWCDRRLLARIHRYTLNQRRRQFEPVSSATFMRFLFHWQRLDDQPETPEALLTSLQQLEGMSLPASSWEHWVLPSRIKNYIPDWLDNLCLTGRVSWIRLSPTKDKKETNKKTPGPIGATPIAILPRQSISLWQFDKSSASDDIPCNTTAALVYAALKASGALFFTDLVMTTGLLRTQVEKALGELVAMGKVSADNFTGLRALITPANRRPKFGGRIGNLRNIEEAGRWWPIDNNPPAVLSISGKAASHKDSDSIEHIAKCLLRRYGIIFRKLVDRESQLPPWRDLLYCYRRMEARDEIRGGRFVQGFSGEQFALPDAVATLTHIKNKVDERQLLCISAADPLNLTGIVTPEQRVTKSTKNRVVYLNGKPIASLINSEIEYYGGQPSSSLVWDIQNLLFSHKQPTIYKNAHPDTTTLTPLV